MSGNWGTAYADLGSPGSWTFAEEIVEFEVSDPEPLAAPVAAVAAAAPGAAVAEDPAAAVAVEDAVAEEETAVAEEETAAIAAGAQPANDGQPDPQVFDLNYFQSFQPFTDEYKQNNASFTCARG